MVYSSEDHRSFFFNSGWCPVLLGAKSKNCWNVTVFFPGAVPIQTLALELTAGIPLNPINNNNQKCTFTFILFVLHTPIQCNICI